MTSVLLLSPRGLYSPHIAWGCWLSSLGKLWFCQNCGGILGEVCVNAFVCASCFPIVWRPDEHCESKTLWIRNAFNPGNLQNMLDLPDCPPWGDDCVARLLRWLTDRLIDAALHWWQHRVVDQHLSGRDSVSEVRFLLTLYSFCTVTKENAQKIKLWAASFSREGSPAFWASTIFLLKCYYFSWHGNKDKEKPQGFVSRSVTPLTFSLRISQFYITELCRAHLG